MALTATSQSALRTGPSWDETIVPALRKRLESESRTLSRRLSAISVTSPEVVNLSSTSNLVPRESSKKMSYAPQSPRIVESAIPRPSLQQSRTSDASSKAGSSSRADNNQSTKAPPEKRARTYSQPYAFDGSHSQNGHSRPKQPVNGVTLPTPESSRSTSPMANRVTDVKPTRIPKARGRTTSTSSHGHSQFGQSPQAYFSMSVNGTGTQTSNNGKRQQELPTPNISPDFWAVEEKRNPSPSSVSFPSPRHSGLLQEQPPFKQLVGTSSTAQSLDHSFDNESNANPRPSTDSEERPFEHWYRGEVSRNGGVGELRVGKRMEMLDIANYGHSLRTPRAPPDTLYEANASRRRKRADSVGARESFYLDDERAKDVARVLDEGPPTDLDGEGDSDVYSNFSHDAAGSAANGHSPNFYQPTPYMHGPQRGSATPTNHQHFELTPTRIPGPAAPRPSFETPTRPTQPPMLRGASEPPSRPSTSSISQQQLSSSQGASSQLRPELATPKRRTKSPSPSTTTSASKRSKQTATKIANQKAMMENANKQSVATYPTPEDGDDMMDAIPSWTQPVPPSGNWDEVVLPVVARKKGLDGQYEQADGSPRPRNTNTMVEPAPGTFGYDKSKYRPPRGDDSYGMDEFGQTLADQSIPEEHEERSPDRQETRRSAHDRTRQPIPEPPPSPLPFAHYAPQMSSRRTDEQVASATTATRTSLEPERQPPKVLMEEDGAGCCKCVVM